MFHILKSNKGSTLIIILMVIMVLGILVPTGYTWYNKLFSNENRLVHQKQAINLSVSAMETFKQQDNFSKVSYLKSNTYPIDQPLIVMNDDQNKLDLYQYAIDKQGNRLSPEQLENHTGEYTVVMRAIAGDLNGDQQKNADEPYFYEHTMTAVEMIADGEVLIEKKRDGRVIESLWMSFHEFLESYNMADDKNGNGQGNGHCKDKGNGHGNGDGNGHEKDKDCDDENKIIDGDVTIFSVGSKERNWEQLIRMIWEESWGSRRYIYFTTTPIHIEAEGSIKLTGPYAITIFARKSTSEFTLKSHEGDISIHYSSLISSGNGNGTIRNLNIEAPQGELIIDHSILFAKTEVHLAARTRDSFNFRKIYFPLMHKWQVDTDPHMILDDDYFY